MKDRIAELLAANNREVEKRRAMRAALRPLAEATVLIPPDQGDDAIVQLLLSAGEFRQICEAYEQGAGE